MQLKAKDKHFMSWGCIVFFLIICFPLGAFLSIKKTQIEISKYRRNSRNLRKVEVVNVVLTLASIAALIIFRLLNLSAGNMYTRLAVCCGILVATLVIVECSYKTIKSKNRLYESYIKVIKGMDEFHISTVANAVDMPRGKVKKDIAKMVNRGYITNATVGKNGEIYAG